MSALDRRLNAYRPGLAARSLEGRVDAARFVDGEPAHVVAPVLPVRPAPEADRPRDTEFLFGEAVTVYDTADGWSWVQSDRDGYVGYVDAVALSYSQPAPTHKISAIRTHLYPAPELKRFAVSALPHGASVHVVDTNGRWSQIADGQWLYSAHLAPLDHRESDPVNVAERFLETPYLWGAIQRGYGLFRLDTVRVDGLRHSLPARFRYAGEAGRAPRRPDRRFPARRPGLLARPCRHPMRAGPHPSLQRHGYVDTGLDLDGLAGAYSPGRRH